MEICQALDNQFNTCVARCPSPSSFTTWTKSIFYVAHVVFTVGWAWFVTVNAKYISPFASLVKTQGKLKMSILIFLYLEMVVALSWAII